MFVVVECSLPELAVIVDSPRRNIGVVIQVLDNTNSGGIRSKYTIRSTERRFTMTRRSVVDDGQNTHRRETHCFEPDCEI